MSAQIQISAGGPPTPGSITTTASTLCTLSNVDNTGILGWFWELLDVPSGSAAALSSSTSSSPTITPDIPGTYLVRLTTYLDVGRTLQDGQDIQGVGVRYTTALTWRLPAAHETNQFDATRGWKGEINSILTDIRSALVVPPPEFSPILWKWNETDTSEFTVALDEIAPGSTALSVQQAAWGPVLRVTFPTKVTGEKLCVITINDPSIVKDANDLYRYVLKYRLVSFSGTATQWYGFGCAFLCNKLTGGSFYGLASLSAANTAGRMVKVEAGTVGLSGATPNWQPALFTAGSGGIDVEFDYTVNAKQPAASPPSFLNDAKSYKAGSSGSAVVKQEAASSFFASSISVFGAGWNTVTPDTCGVAVLGNTGTGAGQYFEIDQIRVERHPMDL